MSNKGKVPMTMLGKVMDLTVKDRLIILQLLPQRTSLVSQIIAKHIVEKVQIKESEKEGIEWKEEAGRAAWKEENAKKRTVKFTSTEIDFLRAQIKEWDEKKSIPMDFVDTMLMIQGMSNIPETEDVEEQLEEPSLGPGLPQGEKLLEVETESPGGSKEPAGD
jgi:hypothetical protein